MPVRDRTDTARGSQGMRKHTCGNTLEIGKLRRKLIAGLIIRLRHHERLAKLQEIAHALRIVRALYGAARLLTWFAVAGVERYQACA